MFSTTTKVWSIRDDGASASVNPFWPVTFIPSPSSPTFVPRTTYVLAGSGDGNLYQLDANDPRFPVVSPLGDGSASVGSPTVDIRHSLIHVGTEQGIIYAVVYPMVP